MYGDIKKTRTAISWTRKPGVTTYECAIEVFDHYPDQPTLLEPGKRIGFDVAIVHKDDPEAPRSDSKPARGGPPSYVTWGAIPTVMKGADAGQLGDLVLAGPR